MAVKYVGQINREIDYICVVADDKPANADIGARLYVTDTGIHYIFDTTSTWVEYKNPKLST